MDYYLLREVFSQVKCKTCQTVFDLDGIEVLHEGRNFALLRISCMVCKQVAGVAIVRFGPTKETSVHAHAATPLSPDLTERDRARLAHLPPITMDDVIQAYRYIHHLDGRWYEAIPSELRHGE